MKRSSPSEQGRKFIEKAREIGADEDTSAANVLMGRLAKMPPSPKVKLESTKGTPRGRNGAKR